MPYIIEPTQGAFTKGRNTLDNAHIVLELLHSITSKDKTLNEGKPCIAFKLDMAKAYDRIMWDFIKQSFVTFGFPNHLIGIIYKCISFTSLSICFYGYTSQYLSPAGGLRQDDPMSPLLLNLCISILSRLIRQACNSGNRKDVYYHQDFPHISHMSFVDDIVIFGEADLHNIQNIFDIVEHFCDISEHKINFQNPRSFSLNPWTRT